MAELAAAQARTNATVDRTSANLDRLSEETRASNKEADRRWGELANKMGTMAEDIVAPGIPEIFHRLFGIEDSDWCVRVRRRRRADRSRRVEFDVVAWGVGTSWRPRYAAAPSQKISPRCCPGSGRFESSSRRRRG